MRMTFGLIAAAMILATGLSTRGDDPPARPTLYLVGDSTVNNGSGKGDGGLWGWGGPAASMFDPSKVRVVNRARGGRSSRTFLTEGLWGKVADDLKPGDFVMIQFGHNDGGPLEGPKARASLKGVGDETRAVNVEATGKPEAVLTYGAYLRRYVQDARARGATPIILSPVPRNMWSADGKSVNRASRDYGKWAGEVAKAEGVPFLDLNEIVARRYEADGKAKVEAEYFTPADHTHTTKPGAVANAEAVVEGVKALEGCEPLKASIVEARAGGG